MHMDRESVSNITEECAESGFRIARKKARNSA